MFPTKRKLAAYTVADKIRIINEIDKGYKNIQVARKLGMPTSTISTILKNRNTIMKLYQSGETTCGGQQKKKMRRAQHSELEKALLLWIKQMQVLDMRLSGLAIMDKANEFARQMNIEGFLASNGWAHRFKGRHNLQKKHGDGPNVDPENKSNELFYSRELQDVLKVYHPRDVFNADETALFWNLLPLQTIKLNKLKKEDCDDGERSRERVTVLVCTNMDGTEKLPLLVIGNCPKPRSFSNIKKLPISFEGNAKAWMTKEIFEKWVKELDAKFALEKRRVALLVDNCIAHGKVPNLEAINLIFLPLNITSNHQPMNKGIVQKLKFLYRRLTLQSLLTCTKMKENYEVDIFKALHNLAYAWSQLTQKNISNSFKLSGFYNEGECANDALAILPSAYTAKTEIDEIDNNEDLMNELRALGVNIPSKLTALEYETVDKDVLTCETLSNDQIIAASRETSSTENGDDGSVNKNMDKDNPNKTKTDGNRNSSTDESAPPENANQVALIEYEDYPYPAESGDRDDPTKSRDEENSILPIRESDQSDDEGENDPINQNGGYDWTENRIDPTENRIDPTENRIVSNETGERTRIPTFDEAGDMLNKLRVYFSSEWLASNEPLMHLDILEKYLTCSRREQPDVASFLSIKLEEPESLD